MLRSLERHAPTVAGGPLVLAVSGGTDSLAMLIAAAAIPETLRPPLIVAHFSHGLRPEAAPAEAALVRAAAESHGMTMVHESGQAAASEAAARNARYGFLARVARDVCACAVATAHTEDDQAETLLLRLTRGTGGRGAGAIRELSRRTVDGVPLTLLRPLLTVSRATTEAVCREAGLTPASDESNASVRYARNRLRLRVLPELARVNPNARVALARYAAIAQEDDDYLEALAVASVAGTEAHAEGTVQWPRAKLAGLADVLLARVLQQAWRRLAGEAAALSAAKVSAAKGLLRGGSSGSLSLGGGLRLLVDNETCRLQRPEGASAGEQPLRVPGVTQAGGWRITVAVDAYDDSALPTNPWDAVLDAACCGDSLTVRGRRDGDRFQPLGMQSTVKLQDVFVNMHIPRWQRDTWPLIAAGKGIAWVPGIRIAEWVKVTHETERVLHLSAERLGTGLEPAP